MGAAEIAMRRYIAQGHLDDNELKGRPLPDRTPPPWVDPVEYQIQGIVDRLMHERPDMDSSEALSEWRRAIFEANKAEVKAKAAGESGTAADASTASRCL